MTDEDQIRRMQALWAEHDADKDADNWSRLFTETGRAISGRGESIGRAAIKKNLEDRTALNPPDRRTMHILGPSVMAVSGDTAEARCGYAAFGRIGDAPWQIMTIGGIYWSLVRSGDAWLFTKVDNRAFGPAAGAATAVHTPTL